MDLEQVKLNPVQESIIQSALSLFAKKGYGQTSVRDIVHKAGTTMPMIYYYFESKEGLYAYILKDAARHLLQSLDPKDKQGASARERLKMGICSFLEFCQINKDEIQLIFSAWFGGELPPEGPSIITVYESMVKQVQTLLQSGIDNQEFKKHDVQEVAQAIIGVMTNYVARILVGGEALDPWHHSEQTMELFIKGLAYPGRYSKRR